MAEPRDIDAAKRAWKKLLARMKNAHSRLERREKRKKQPPDAGIKLDVDQSGGIELRVQYIG